MPPAVPQAKGGLTHYPAPPAEGAPPADPETVERILSDWFERPVVLLGSGRAGLSLYLRALGLGRYRDRIAVPPYLSACVTDVLNRHAFPVHGTGGEATLLYHQYGLPQVFRPEGPVLEDICHRFFETAATGARDWIGEAAVFSLPKFLGIAGMGGGLVVKNDRLARQIRTYRDEAEAELPGMRDWMRTVVSATYRDPSASPLAPLLEPAYALLTRYPRPDGADLAGFPEGPSGLAGIGERRSRVAGRLLSALPDGAMPGPVRAALEGGIPFAFPFFGSGDTDWLRDRDTALAEAGIHAGVYNVDVRMDMGRPDYRPCILVPCHQDVDEAGLDAIVGILGRQG